MVQQLGETTDEMMKADDLDVQKILNARPSGHYWIVIHHKRTKMRMDSGEQVLMRIVKAYDIKPKSLMGTVILEIKDGELINYTISPHDAPVNWEAIEKKVGLITTPTVYEHHPISRSYVYNR